MSPTIYAADRRSLQDNSRMRAAHQFCQCALAIFNRCAAQVFTVEFNKIESNQQRISTVRCWRMRVEPRQPALIGDDGFPVDQERVRPRQCGVRRRRRRIGGASDGRHEANQAAFDARLCSR